MLVRVNDQIIVMESLEDSAHMGLGLDDVRVKDKNVVSVDVQMVAPGAWLSYHFKQNVKEFPQAR